METTIERQDIAKDKPEFAADLAPEPYRTVRVDRSGTVKYGYPNLYLSRLSFGFENNGRSVRGADLPKLTPPQTNSKTFETRRIVP